MKRIEKNIKKRYKAIFAAILSIVILLGVIVTPNGAKAKTLSYDAMSLRATDYTGSFFFPGDVVDVADDAFLNVRYYIHTGEHTDAELSADPDIYFVPFEAAWNGSENYEDIDHTRFYKSDFTFPAKPDSGSSDYYVYEVFSHTTHHAGRTLVMYGDATDCSIMEVMAYPAHRVTFHDKNGDALDLGFNVYLYEVPVTLLEDPGNPKVYLMTASDSDSIPLVPDDENLGELIGWANSPEFVSDFDSPDIGFDSLADGFEWGSEMSPSAISEVLDFYPVYECLETTLEVSAEDIIEGASIKDYLSIETNRPSDKRDYTFNYERINEDGTVEAIEGEPTEAGDYQVIVKLAKSGETFVNSDGMVESRAYSPASDSAKFSILSDTSLTKKPAAKKLTYNGEAQALVAEGKADGGEILYSLSKDGEYSKNIPNAKDAGEYTVWYKVKGIDGRKDIDPDRVKVTIAKKTVGLEWSDTEFTYDGKEHCPKASATGLAGSDKCDVTVTGASKEIGKHTAKAVSLSNENYELPTDNTKEFEIKEEPKQEEQKEEKEEKPETKPEKKLEGSVSIQMKSFYYGGKASSPEISSKTNDTSKATVRYTREGTAGSSATIPTEVGNYIATVTLPENDKYAACSATCRFTIAYLPTPDDGYTLDATKGEKGYYKSDVKIIPKKGFEISYGDRRHYSNNPIKIEKSMNSISFFLRDASTLEETAVIVVGNVKIDSTAPKVIDMTGDGLYFGDDNGIVKGVVNDENIDRVLLGEKPVELKSDGKGNMTFDIPVERKKTNVTFTVFDEAGNKTEISIKVAPGWRKDGKVRKGRLFIPADEKSTFPEGSNWGTGGKKTVFIGGNDFYPVVEGEYDFEER